MVARTSLWHSPYAHLLQSTEHTSHSTHYKTKYHQKTHESGASSWDTLVSTMKTNAPATSMQRKCPKSRLDVYFSPTKTSTVQSAIVQQQNRNNERLPNSPNDKTNNGNKLSIDMNTYYQNISAISEIFDDFWHCPCSSTTMTKTHWSHQLHHRQRTTKHRFGASR